ncbi:PKD domain-containing protein [Candidatus Bipolaricaulota bacterium]|nr:PKD domain-containing protein [Candidatus Bipolaricaulota bacterium]
MASKQTHFVAVLVTLVSLFLGLSGCELMQPGPSADFTISPVIVYAGETFELNGSLSLGSAAIVSYTWELGDGQSLVGQQVNAALSFPGTYSVVLTVEDANGNLDLATQQMVVYARTGTVILDEDFADGELALARWVLDPTWASAGDAQIDFIRGGAGNALYIHSAASRWHRRYHAIELPPLRVGQKAVFSCRIMTLRNQDFHTFLFAPGRVELGSLVGALPYFLFTNEGGGSYIQIPSTLGTDIGHPIGYKPDVYRWHTYSFVFDQDSFELLIDDVSWMEGPLDVPFSDSSIWSILIGEESLTETCNAYFDDIRVTIEE